MLKKELSRVAPDYRRMVAAAENCRSEILPLYEHNVSCKIIDELAGSDVCGRMESGDFDAAFAAYGEFFRLAGYDVVTFEYCIGAAMPPGGALRGGMGPIQSPGGSRSVSVGADSGPLLGSGRTDVRSARPPDAVRHEGDRRRRERRLRTRPKISSGCSTCRSWKLTIPRLMPSSTGESET